MRVLETGIEALLTASVVLSVAVGVLTLFLYGLDSLERRGSRWREPS
jgi:hypothetical protein